MSDRLTSRVRKGLIYCFAAAGLLLLLHSWAVAQSKIPVELRPAIVRVEALAAAELAKDNLGSVTIGVISGPELIWAKLAHAAAANTSSNFKRNIFQCLFISII